MDTTTREYTDAELLEAHTLHYAQDHTWAEVADQVGAPSANAMRKAVYRARDRGLFESGGGVGQAISKGDRVTIAGLGTGGQSIESPKSTRIRTLDDLIEACEIDLAKWTIDKHVVNKWETGAVIDGRMVAEPLYQVKAWLSPRMDIINAREIIGSQIEDMRRHSPKYRRPGKAQPSKGEHLLEIPIADPHFGLYSWAAESGEPYDLETAERIVPESVRQLADRARSTCAIREILLYLAGDISHIDATIRGSGGQTTKGTPLDVSGRYPEIFMSARRGLVASIDYLETIAPVTVIGKTGNHDELTAFGLMDSLQSWYRLNDRVTILNSPQPYTLWRWEKVLFGFTHGHLAKADKLPLIMATEASAEDWVASELGWREWHIAHTHRVKMTDRVMLDEDRRIRVRVVPSLAATDAWHSRMGFMHRRCAEAYLWHEHDCFAGMLNVNASELDGIAA